MSAMQFTTKRVYRHKLLAPQGKKFDSAKIRNIKHIVSEVAYLIMDDLVLCWEDADIDLCMDLDASFFEEHLSMYLIDINQLEEHK